VRSPGDDDGGLPAWPVPDQASGRARPATAKRGARTAREGESAIASAARAVAAQGRYRAGPKYRWRMTVREARRRDIAVALDETHAIRLMARPCVYCGREPVGRSSGLDRVNNALGYRPDNVAPACWDCNRMKGTASARDFVLACARVRRHRARPADERDDPAIRWSRRPSPPASATTTTSIWREPAFDAEYARYGVGFARYRRRAQRLGLRFEVDAQWFDFTVVEGVCAYCGRDGEPGRPLGLDRVDNAGGYEADNVVACCSRCNHMKGALAAADFVSLCERVAARWSACAEACAPGSCAGGAAFAAAVVEDGA
jgi:5-methylcytosine-specific restriction endonuclease McrA